eukprot:GSChrysophyteH1.ASY1.ANO1.2077.1 assembled CDS
MPSKSSKEAETPLVAKIVRFLLAQAIIAGIVLGLSKGAGVSHVRRWKSFITDTLFKSPLEPQVTDSLHNLAIVSLAVNMVSFVCASGILFGNAPTERFYDLTGALTYITVLSISIMGGVGGDFDWQSLSTRQKVLSGMVLFWCVRLGSFLFSRINRDGGVDSRFVDIKRSALRFCTAYSLQALWVFITALPVFTLNVKGDSAALNSLDYVGWGLWLVGITIEIQADSQKNAFKANSHNEGKFIKSGLWAYSRHPNYFGEIMLWVGIFISSSVLWLSCWWSPQLMTLAISPLFVYYLLNYVSGVNLLESSADKKWGTRQDYLEYKSKTPALTPFFGKY